MGWMNDDLEDTPIEAWTWGGSVYPDWQGFVRSFAAQTIEDRGEIYKHIDPLTNRIAQYDKDLAIAVNNTWTLNVIEAMQEGGWIGFALARTWPAGLDGFSALAGPFRSQTVGWTLEPPTID